MALIKTVKQLFSHLLSSLQPHTRMSSFKLDKKDDLFETDNLLWQFEEFIKTLVAMKSTWEEQKKIYGIGIATDEMVEDFHSYYELNVSRYEERGLINSESKASINQIGILIDKWGEEKGDSFWYEFEKHQDEWDTLRILAADALNCLNYDNAHLSINHKSVTDWKGNITYQTSNIKLKKS